MEARLCGISANIIDENGPSKSPYYISYNLYYVE
jgi:hypothetical protein